MLALDDEEDDSDEHSRAPWMTLLVSAFFVVETGEAEETWDLRIEIGNACTTSRLLRSLTHVSRSSRGSTVDYTTQNHIPITLVTLFSFSLKS